MNVNTGIKQAVILAIGIIVLGFCVKSGLESVIAKDRKVMVKGLAEKEVEADKVTWPIVSKEIGILQPMQECVARHGDTPSGKCVQRLLHGHPPAE